MSYNAVVARIHTRPLLGADKLVIGDVLGYSVIVGIDTPQDALGIFFEAGGQLSDEFCKANNLYRIKDADGKDIGGMFEDNRRVKCIKLRGAKSEGFWIPIQSLAFTGHDLCGLKEGDSFDMFGDVPICRKYETPAQRAKGVSNAAVKVRKANICFPKHYDTAQFKRVGKDIPVGSIIYTSLKVHGTSQRTGVVLDEVLRTDGMYGLANRFFQLNWLYAIAPFRWGRKQVVSLQAKAPKFTHRVYAKLNGTRNTVIEKRTTPGFYGEEEGFRLTCAAQISPHKGEVFFYEIVGFTESGASIMASHDTGVLKSKEFTKKYGQTMVYKYGCLPKECKVFVYRIIMVNEDGKIIEYSWPQVVSRCKELGLTVVPEACPPFVYDGDFDALQKKINALVEGESGNEILMTDAIDHTTLLEGVVVRYEHESGFGWLKNKSYAFLAMELGAREDNKFFDREEIS